MQSQARMQASIATTEDDILMNSPFAMEGQYDQQQSKTAARDIVHADNHADWTQMDCDEDDSISDLHHLHHHQLVRNGGGMASHDSTGSLDSASSSSSSVAEYEPELSQSFGSTRSYDLMTPIKPHLPIYAPDSLQQFSFAKTSTMFEDQQSLPNSPRSALLQTSPTSTTTTMAQNNSNASALLDARHLNQQRHNLGESLGLKLDVQGGEGKGSFTTATIRSSRPTPPGLAGRLKISLPNSSAFNGPNAPQTPGGHIASGARDGAATGGPPLSPFEPPTPVYAPVDSPFTLANNDPAATPPQTTVRPKLQQRHTITPLRQEASSVLPMSPITSQFAAVSMRKTSSSKGVASDASTAVDSSTLLTPPYSPFATAKKLSGELDIPSTAAAMPLERRSSTSSTTSSTGGSSTKKRSDVVRSAVSPRSKAGKMNKVSPYPLPRDDKTMTTSSSKASQDVGTAPAPSSLFKDVVKPPMVAPSMAKSLSEPVPKTVSARHLAHRTLHPTFTANYTLGDELGSGGFGFVVSATRDRDGMPVAVKFIWKDKVPTHGWVRDDEFGAIPMEAFVLKVVDNPFVVKFVDLFDDDQFFYLVMEHHGSPWKAAPSLQGDKKGSKVEVMDEGVAVDKSQQVTLPTSTAMKTTQSQPNPASAPSPTFAVFPPESDVPITHDSPVSFTTTSSSSSTDTLATPAPARPTAMERRSSCDLFECIEQHSRLSEDKARWVFAQIVEAVYYLDKRGICHRDIKDENCVIDSDFNVKLIDFGSAVITDPRRPTPYFNRFFGTMTFASSEILQGKQYRAPHAEVWSLGVLLSILLSGECPFAGPTAAIRGKISKPSGMWSNEALNLLMACLVVNPDKRATISQIRHHPWVTKAWLQNGRQRPSDNKVNFTG